MGRVYSIVTGFQTVSVAQDLIELKAGSTRSFKLLSVTVSCTSDYDDTSGVQITIKRGTGYTSGDGNVQPVVQFDSSGDANESFAENRINSTVTQAVAGGGSLFHLYEEAMAPAAGFQFTPTPEMQPVFAAGEGLVVSVSLPADAITMSAVAIVEEL